MNNEEQKAKERKSFIEWVKEHKEEIIVTAIIATVGAVLITKNWDSIKGVFTTEQVVATVKKNEQVVGQAISPTISNDILDNLTGNKMTATNLGKIVLCSPREINKRIVSEGLATRLPCGDYVLTEAGKLVGESTLKTNRYGHTFSNNEWEEKIIEILFSPQELQNIEKYKIEVKEILENISA